MTNNRRLIKSLTVVTQNTSLDAGLLRLGLFAVLCKDVRSSSCEQLTHAPKKQVRQEAKIWNSQMKTLEFFRKSFFICGCIFNGATESNIKLKQRTFTVKSIKQIMLTSPFHLSHAPPSTRPPLSDASHRPPLLLSTAALIWADPFASAFSPPSLTRVFHLMLDYAPFN